MSNPSLPGGGACRSQICPSEGSHQCSPSSTTDDRDFAIDHLAGLPQAERQAVVAFVVFWFSLNWPTRAKLAKIAKPDLNDDEVARLVGRSRRHLLRDDGYKALKPTLNDFKASRPRSDFSAVRRRGFGHPDHPDG
jgi:hypothetical protein